MIQNNNVSSNSKTLQAPCAHEFLLDGVDCHLLQCPMLIRQEFADQTDHSQSSLDYLKQKELRVIITKNVNVVNLDIILMLFIGTPHSNHIFNAKK